ncbi:hypothetical protein [Streptomyces sp. HUAS TT7]|uniref:hypothetical protein n=1 Tax=Streptomyces sp. HUAS TT7 TaxID=3447507 RepID=UPI003F65982E
MTSHADGMLRRGRLVHWPYSQGDIDAAEARLAARVGAAPTVVAPQATSRWGTWGSRGANDAAAQDLMVLCEAVAVYPGAITSLHRFLARALPEPLGARVLGCLLQLSEREDSARFWWQYAAGAGDYPATYCLYLQHRALGEHDVANWWLTQTDAVTTQSRHPDDVDIDTALRVLRALKTTDAGVPDVIHAVLDYVPAAVAYVDDDLDLPLPDPDFTDHIHALTTQAIGQPPARASRAPLPERQRGATVAHWLRRTSVTQPQ